MSIETLLTQTVTVSRPAWDAVDEYGDVQPGTTTTATWPARLEQLSTDEIVRDRDTVVADWRAFLPASATVGPFDTVQEGGRTFEVWGDPTEHHTPAGLHHLEIRLRRVT